MAEYPRVLYRGPADASAEIRFVQDDDQLETALASGWRRRRVVDVIPAPVVDPSVDETSTASKPPKAPKPRP